MELAGDMEKRWLFHTEKTAFQKTQKLEKRVVVEKLLTTSINN